MADDRSTTIVNFYAEYHDLRNRADKTELFDVLGFLMTRTQPSHLDHIYFRFIELEDRHLELLKRLRTEWKTDIPCIQNLLLADLKVRDAVNPKFFEELSSACEE